jgi:putative DNA primase/helicase
MAARAIIDLTEPLHIKVAKVIEALAIANDERTPGVMVRGNELVRMTERGELESFVVDSLRVAVSERAQFQVATEDGYTPKDPPRDVILAVLAEDSSAYADLPRVDRVVDVPVLDAGGDLITEPGYHPTSRLYYRPAEVLEGVGPRDADSTEDVEWAKKKLLDDLLGDFDFDDEPDRAHALGLLLLPFVRERIGSGSTPLHVVLAPDVGSGKTWLAQAALLPGCGTVPATPGTGSEEEWRKRITSMLLAGNPAVLLDNLSGTLDTGAFAAALTTDRWKDRILGESREVDLPIRNLWAVTGNNLSLSPEITRRAVAVFLEPGDTKASEKERKKFRHPDLLNWATGERRALVEAALTLIDHWRQGPAVVEPGGYTYGRTGEDAQECTQTLGSYERWAAIIGGILESAEVSGFLGNRDKLAAEADDESREAREFLAALHDAADGPMQAKDVAALCAFGSQLADVVPEGPAEAGDGTKLTRALGQWLGDHKNRTVGGYTLRCQPLPIKGQPRGWYVQDRLQRDAAPPS